MSNHVSTRINAERKIVTLQMTINGQPGQWIEFNAAQLGNLIDMLQNDKLILDTIEGAKVDKPRVRRKEK